MNNLYLEVEQHPSGWWFNVVDPRGTPEHEAIVLTMDGPYPNEGEASCAGANALNRQFQSAA